MQARSVRWARGAIAIAVGAMLGSVAARAEDTVRIGVPTKTYYPTIIAETALRQKLFEKEGIKAELTIYRSGGETFEAAAAGAADLQLNSVPLVAAGRKKGVLSKAVAGSALGYYGWYLMVKPDSPVKDAAALDGKKVGITAAGSGSDLLARWTMQDRKIKFTTVPLGGSGLVPNLLSGNVDAIVLYSPLSFQMMQDKQARSLIDFGEAVPSHVTGVWIASDKYIAEKPKAVQAALNALYGGLVFLQTHRAEGIKMIAEIDEIPDRVAEAELDGNLKKLSTTGEMTEEWMSRALDFAKLIGMTDVAPVGDTYVTTFRPQPTK